MGWIGEIDKVKINSEKALLLNEKINSLPCADHGKEILLKDSGANICVDNNLSLFIDAIDSLSPKTAYDVEREYLKVISDRMDNVIFNGIKDYVYNSPQDRTFTAEDGEALSVRIDMQRILIIMSIYLCDKYFNVHKELDTSGFPACDCD